MSEICKKCRRDKNDSCHDWREQRHQPIRCDFEPQPPQGEEGPYTDNEKKLGDFEYVLYGPGVEKEMLHLQLATLSPRLQVLKLLNFGYAQGRSPLVRLTKEISEYEKGHPSSSFSFNWLSKRITELEKGEL